MFDWIFNTPLISASRYLEDNVCKLVVHLVSRFDYNTRVMVNASSNPPLSRVKLLQQNLELNDHVSMN